MAVSEKKRQRQAKRRERAIKHAEYCATIPAKELPPKPKKLGAAESRRRLDAKARQLLRERGVPFV